MIAVDVVCPLFRAEKYIDGLISGLKNQKDITVKRVIFAVTEWDGMEPVLEKLSAENFTYFTVKPDEFSHSMTREQAIREYCGEDVVIMLSQDVKLCDENAFSRLAEAINGKIPFAYGRQICGRKTIEYYIRNKNYGDEAEYVTKEDIERLQLKAFFASDAFSAYFRPVFLELNGYDGVHMMMNEDMYYSKKVLENGYTKAYIPSAVVEHSHKLKLKALYNRYCETGKWLAAHPEFDKYKTTDTGKKLALYVLGRALRDFNIPVLFRWLPDMAARYLGLKKGKKIKNG